MVFHQGGLSSGWSFNRVWLIDDHLYSAILRSLEQTHCARLWFYMSYKLFIAHFLNIHQSGVLTALAWLVPHETAAISAQVLCTPYNHASCHFMQSHIRKVYASLAVTCHLHWPGSFTCYCSNTGVERIPKLESAQKVNPGEETSPTAPTGIWTRDLSVTSPPL